MKYARKQENSRPPKKVQNETVNLTTEKSITPRKQANYESPKKKVRSRKRKSNLEKCGKRM